MAAKKQQTKKPSDNPQFRGFLNIPLSDEDKSIIKATAYDEATWQGDLEKWCDNGFKFTFSSDDYNRCFQVVGGRAAKDHRDYGILLTGRGSTPIKAFKQWVYIQTRLVGDADWSELMDETPRFSIDD